MFNSALLTHYCISSEKPFAFHKYDNSLESFLFTNKDESYTNK